MRHQPALRTLTTITMTTSRKRDRPSAAGERRLRNSWKVPITADEIAENYRVSGEHALRLRELLLAAKDTYDTLAAYQKELQTPALKSVRSAAESFRRRFEDLRTEWQTFRRDDHESAARINWHAAYNSNLRVSNATGSPPDVIDAILSKLEHFMTEQTLEFTPMRRDSNNVWRES